VKVAVFGASGFVGATFVERMLASRGVEVKALIHTTGNAWRLARHAIPLHPVDVTRRADVRAALEDCTHVVNCARGGPEVMGRGLANLLAASREARVRRFVHLSSIALYGALPPDTVVDEATTPRPVRGQYGWVKLRQDAAVERAHGRGLPCVVICPAHVFGAYSQFLLACIQALRVDRFALVEEGKLPAAYVDVANLAQALELALECPDPDGRRVVVEDGQDVTWAQVADALAPLAEREPPFASLLRAAARVIAEEGTAPGSLGRSARHLLAHTVSPAFKAMLKSDPYLAKLGEAGLRVARRLPRALGGPRLLAGARSAESEAAGPAFDAWSTRAQYLSVRFDGARARRVLGYVPERSFARSMAALAAWYRETHGFGSEEWPLLREI